MSLFLITGFNSSFTELVQTCTTKFEQYQILLLFYDFFSLVKPSLGCIGFIMRGGGLKELLSIILRTELG